MSVHKSKDCVRKITKYPGYDKGICCVTYRNWRDLAQKVAGGWDYPTAWSYGGIFVRTEAEKFVGVGLQAKVDFSKRLVFYRSTAYVAIYNLSAIYFCHCAILRFLETV